MNPYQVNPYARANHGHVSAPASSNLLDIRGSSLPLNKASCNWLDSISPPHLGASIKHALLGLPQSLTPVSGGPADVYALKFLDNQHEREVRLNLTAHTGELALGAVQLAPDQVVKPGGPVAPGPHASFQAKLWFMDHLLNLSNANPAIDSHKLAEQLSGADQTARDLGALHQQASKLSKDRASLANNLSFARSPAERDQMQRNITQIDRSLTQLQTQKGQLEKHFLLFQTRFDFVNRGAPPLNVSKGANNPYKAEVKAFLKDLHENDRDSFRKRFDDLRPRDVDLSYYDKVLLVFHGNKVIGMADCTRDDEMTPKTATINSVVHRDYQKLNVGKILTESRDQVLLSEGYSYKSGGIYRTNTDQIDRLRRNGWHETASSVNDPGEMRYFWKALDPKFANSPPREL
ncbi:hypothetical protein A7J50_6007 (plasmid) [Pseudomonas antarctica]|uniref:N-acetyltransferase domain-containing protein n=1 Tax=Pseudomonas antarctica TaxID=219572 RepID=A0A172Z9X0_9PSED|nr:GNAT family N-acetyltransferase [Pseudomonas antarctica]ANF89307.1 hypothetical protein A7J50_6007 [Pseudomonas antarctica]